jgi:pyruvate/2-oxoglutarate dehydrogenase complex dihydrolipoamide acyltransferase (E2) component
MPPTEETPGFAPVIIPQLGANPVIRLLGWRVEPGESLQRGDALVELSTPGVVTEVASPVAGRLAAILREPGTVVAPGEVVGWIERPSIVTTP